jgi:predicted O-methyltransferase YrrM
MQLENALQIPGWMEEHDLLWLAEKAATHERIVEVGAWMGRSTKVLSDNTPGTVWAVDHWLGSIEHQPCDSKAVWAAFQQNLTAEIFCGKVVPIMMHSVSAAKFFADQSHYFDMVFVDASHDYDNVRADILAWKPLVKSGGILCGHDASHPPIMQATHELLPGVRHEHSMWVIDL